MSTSDVAVIAVTAFNLAVTYLNHKREMNRTAWFAERTRVVAPPKPAGEQPAYRDAKGHLRDSRGRFTSGAVDLSERRAG